MVIKATRYFFYSFLAYLFIGFFLLPPLLKPQLIKIIQKETKIEATIKSLAFNPLLCSIELQGVALRDLHAKKLFSFEKLSLNLNPTSLLYGAFELKELSLVAPKIYIVYDKDRTLNLVKVLHNDKESKRDTSKKATQNRLPRIIIDKVRLENGHIDYKDYTHKTPFTFSFENIGFSFKNFDTKTITKESAKVRFYSTLYDGGFIDFQSKITSIVPLKIEGTVALEASQLYTEWKYLQDVLKLEVADGKLSFATKYTFNLDDINATKLEGLHLSLEKLRIKPKEKKRDILNLQNLSIQNATILPMQQKIEIDRITLDGLKVEAKRNREGNLDWLEYVKTADEQVDTNQSTTESRAKKPWNLKLHSLTLEKINLLFQDKALSPNVTTAINKLDIYAKDITLAGEKPLSYKINASINKNTLCNLSGSFQQKKLMLRSSISCKDFDIAHYSLYIKQVTDSHFKKFDLALASTFLDFQTLLKVDKNSTINLSATDTNITLKNLILRKKSSREKLLSWRDVTLKDLQLSTAKKELSIAKIDLNRVVADVIRKKDRSLNIADMVLAKKASSKKVATKSKKEELYHIKIGEIALNNAKCRVVDRSLKKRQKHTLDKITIRVHNIDSKKRSWLKYKASMRLNKSGVLKADGKLCHTPLQQNGTISAKNIDLTAVTPYLQEQSFLSVDDGKLSFHAKESYIPSSKFADMHLHGELAVNSLFVTDTKDTNSSLFSLNKLSVRPFTLELFPNRLYIDSVDLDSFYVRAKIDENKTINFSQLMRTKKESHPKRVEEKKSAIFPVKIAKVNIKNGSAYFSDLSLPIKFQTDIHDLNGVVYAISSSAGDTSYVDITGEVNKYGSTKLQGSIDSFNPKEYTDLQMDFKNINLHSLSGYSASFAGYEIDSGKLYLDLGYNILHSKLHATNNIMIKNIELGKELEDENVTHLPLGLAIGLLEDNDGIVDINMPIEGDIDNPDFKYGAVVWKTVGNLIAKAVTSPFKFLGSMLGIEGEDLEFIAFEFGKSNITPSQREKLDNIAKLMIKRPKISLKIDGVYDEKEDLKVLKLQKLIALVMQKSGQENIQNARTALNIDILENIYMQSHKRDRLEKIKEQLQKEFMSKEAFQRGYQNRLIRLCSDMQRVEKKELKSLAQERVEKVQSYLTQERFIAKSRVQIGDIIEQHSSDAKRVQLQLNIIVH